MDRPEDGPQLMTEDHIQALADMFDETSLAIGVQPHLRGSCRVFRDLPWRCPEQATAEDGLCDGCRMHRQRDHRGQQVYRGEECHGLHGMMLQVRGGQDG